VEEHPGGVDHAVGGGATKTDDQIGGKSLHVWPLSLGDAGAGQVESGPSRFDEQWAGEPCLAQSGHHVVHRGERPIGVRVSIHT
jgi:hypothetical protein